MALLVILFAAIIFIISPIVIILVSLLESLIEYSTLIEFWIAFNTAFIIQTVIAIISKINKKKFGKGNVIRLIIFGIISFALFVVTFILIFIKNFQAWKELYYMYS